MCEHEAMHERTLALVWLQRARRKHATRLLKSNPSASPIVDEPRNAFLSNWSDRVLRVEDELRDSQVVGNHWQSNAYGRADVGHAL
jgi:hypothetical protein